MWTKGRSYSIVGTSAIEADVNRQPGPLRLSAENPQKYVIRSQLRIDSNRERILSTRVLNNGSVCVAPEIFSMLWMTVE